MKVLLNTPLRKWTLLTIALVFSAAYVGWAALQFAASWLENRPDLSSLQRAARLDPGNAEYRDRLGRYYDFVVRDPVAALAQYKSAVQINPHSARYWFDLASAYQILGDTGNQSAALERAIQADAMTPDIAWEAGNLFLVQGQTQRALRELRVVIANDPSLADAAMQLCWRIQPDVDALLRDVIPDSSNGYLGFLLLLESKEETEGAMKAWNALLQTREPFEIRHSYSFIRYLLQHKAVDQAVTVWKQTASRFSLSSYLPSSSNLVVNGNFSLDVLNAGFDWQYQKQGGVNLSLDPSDFHSGKRSLLIAFDGPGISEAGIYQLIAVQPKTAYDFTAYYKNSEMQGAGGPHFTIQDMYDQTVYYESDELKDAGFWKSADGEFTTGPDCKLVLLHIRRLPAGSPIRGKLWVDDFHLAPKSP
jgi:tetratricopeptide (TPR) repeat protein